MLRFSERGRPRAPSWDFVVSLRGSLFDFFVCVGCVYSFCRVAALRCFHLPRFAGTGRGGEEREGTNPPPPLCNVPWIGGGRERTDPTRVGGRTLRSASGSRAPLRMHLPPNTFHLASWKRAKLRRNGSSVCHRRRGALLTLPVHKSRRVHCGTGANTRWCARGGHLRGVYLLRGERHTRARPRCCWRQPPLRASLPTQPHTPPKNKKNRVELNELEELAKWC